MQKWEYRQAVVVDSDANKILSQMGGEGWELVSVHPQAQEDFDLYQFFFKRPLIDARKDVAAYSSSHDWLRTKQT